MMKNVSLKKSNNLRKWESQTLTFIPTQLFIFKNNNYIDKMIDIIQLSQKKFNAIITYYTCWFLCYVDLDSYSNILSFLV